MPLPRMQKATPMVHILMVKQGRDGSSSRRPMPAAARTSREGAVDSSRRVSRGEARGGQKRTGMTTLLGIDRLGGDRAVTLLVG
jgi:hypothetical protein